MAVSSDSDSGDDRQDESTSSELESDALVESLVAGRAKRATAGNRLSTLLDQEADDELELLFAEDEEDVEFEAAEVEDDADVQFESSDEDDGDQGPPGEKDEEDLEGERELQQQSRTERQAKKRKAQDAVFKPQAFRKKVKIDPTNPSPGPSTPAAKLKKKPERLSWITSSADGPTRSSSRTATVQNKEVVRARIKASETRRQHQIAVMEAAAKRKETRKSKVMSQEERLAEALRTERLNSKSLNRWEATEKRRSEEEKARLMALRNRKLEGPVITWWSGLAEWFNGKLRHVGRRPKISEPEPEEDGGDQHDDSDVKGSKSEAVADVEGGEASQIGRAQDTIVPTSSLQDIITVDLDADVGNSSNLVPRLLDGASQHTSMPVSANEGSALGDPSQAADEQHQLPRVTQTGPELSTRSLVVLENFDPASIKDRDGQRCVLFKSRAAKVQKPAQEMCVITSHPARYRDPATGLAYVNSAAYKEIQKLASGGCRWSNLLGCYVGPVGVAARGVPARFLQEQEGGASTERV